MKKTKCVIRTEIGTFPILNIFYRSPTTKMILKVGCGAPTTTGQPCFNIKCDPHFGNLCLIYVLTEKNILTKKNRCRHSYSINDICIYITILIKSLSMDQGLERTSFIK